MSAQPHDRHDHQAAQPGDREDQRVACPFCGSTDTELISLFGSQLSTSQYQCRACHTYFERMKQDSPGMTE